MTESDGKHAFSPTIARQGDAMISSVLPALPPLENQLFSRHTVLVLLTETAPLLSLIAPVWQAVTIPQAAPSRPGANQTDSRVFGCLTRKLRRAACVFFFPSFENACSKLNSPLITMFESQTGDLMDKNGT
jgi:hypothetical protein